MGRVRRALKFALPYGIVRAYQIAHERDALRAQLEAEHTAAPEREAAREMQAQIERERAEEQEKAAREQTAREEAEYRDRERKLFTENEIVYSEKRVFTFSDVPNTTFNITGSGNVIRLNDFSGGGHAYITIQDSVRDCRIDIGENNRIFGNLFVHFYFGGGRAPNKSTIRMGDNNVVNGNLILIGGMQPGTVVSIGNENLFADNVNLIGAVDHLTYNVKTKEKYCQELGVAIRDRVWICRDTLFLNGARVGSDAIVAARSVVNKAFDDKNVLISGIPAKITKTDVMWHLNTTDEYIFNPSPLMV